MDGKRAGYTISGVISASASLAVLALSLKSASGDLFYFMNPQSIGIYGNVIIYLLTGGIFFLLFVLLSLAVKHDRFPDLNISMRVRYCSVAVCSVTAVVAVILFHLVLNRGYCRVEIFPSYILLATAMMITLASLIILYYEKGKFNKNWILYMIYVCVAVILGLTAITPNTFQGDWLTFGTQTIDTSFNVHHSSAYIDSIYNVLHGVPFIGGVTEQYGHYSLFFYPFLKIFGESTLTISVIMGILLAVSALCLMGAVHVSVRSNYLKALVAIAGGLCLAVNTAGYIYWQTIPHRMIFPSVMILMIALYAKKDALAKREYVLGSLVSILAILWNLESGIAVAASWFMFITVKYYQDNDFDIRGFIKKLLLMVAALALYMLVPYLIVNFYNCLVAGFDASSLLSVKDFIGAVTNPDYFAYLNSKWGLFDTSTELMMFLFMGCIAWALVSTSILSSKGKRSTPSVVAASISITGLVLLTKCVNNTGGVPVEVWLFAAAALGIFASQMIGEIKNIKKWKGFDLHDLVKVSVCSLALIGIVMMGTHAADMGKNIGPLLDPEYDEFVKFTKEIGRSVPEGTLGIGEGTSAIFMELGWDKHHYVFNPTDDEFNELFSTNDSFFTLTHREGVPVKYLSFIDLGEYHLVEDYTYKGMKYGYYVRNT